MGAAGLRTNVRKGERREVPSVPPPSATKENAVEASEQESKPALLKRKSTSATVVMSKMKSADFQQDAKVAKKFKRSGPPAELARSKTYAGFGDENNAQPNSPPPSTASSKMAARPAISVMQPL